MTTRSYQATRTRSNGRPGFSVTFSHPLRTDARGKVGLKVRRGLGTTDPDEAQQLVDQLNELLADQSWWSLDRLGDAGRHFNSNIVAAFFDGIEVGKIDPRNMREEVMPLPTPDQGYARVMLVGSTGAGKTTEVSITVSPYSERQCLLILSVHGICYNSNVLDKARYAPNSIQPSHKGGQS